MLRHKWDQDQGRFEDLQNPPHFDPDQNRQQLIDRYASESSGSIVNNC